MLIKSHGSDQLIMHQTTLSWLKFCFNLCLQAEHRLWSLYYCEIEPFQALFHAGSKGPLQANRNMRAFARKTLFELLKATSIALQQAVAAVRGAETASSSDSVQDGMRTDKHREISNLCRLSRSRLFTSMGDIERYKQLYCSPNATDWRDAKKWYERALQLNPSIGKVRVQSPIQLCHFCSWLNLFT